MDGLSSTTPWDSDFAAKIFPSPALDGSVGAATSSAIVRMHLKLRVANHPLEDALQLSWALILSQYTRSNDILFKTRIRYPSIAEFPDHKDPVTDCSSSFVQWRLSLDKTVNECIKGVRSQRLQPPLVDTEGINANVRDYLKDQNQLAIYLYPSCQKPAWVCALENPQHISPLNGCPLLMECVQNTQFGILCCATFDNKRIDKEQVNRIIHQFIHVSQQILNADEVSRIGDIEFASPWDISTFERWNSDIIENVDDCLHNLICQQSSANPAKIAVASWDGELNYQRLNELSSQLACHLEGVGVGSGTIVPLLFEKSMWTIVAMVAVLKAGATCVAIDVSYPTATCREIIQQTKAKIILASNSQSTARQELDVQMLTVSAQQVGNWKVSTEGHQPNTKPSDTAFIIFTSGSTGKPKGIVFNHSALTTSMKHHSRSLDINQESRVLQFSSYAFDVSIYEIFTTLTRGGCVCVPSERQRKHNISEFIQMYHVTWAFFTASFLRTLQPKDVPSLTTIAVGGEAVAEDIARTWASKVQLYNAYGPAECTICASGLIPPEGWIAGTFGRAVGCTLWVTDTSNPNKLAALGTVGELLIEGPILAQGYLNDAEKTKSNFIQSPAWKRKFGLENTFYRTGDLVCYNTDGTVRYIGRNDTQVKINGQRLELESVEVVISRVQGSIDSDINVEVVVQVGLPKGENKTPVLAAFFCRNQGDKHNTHNGSSTVSTPKISPDLEPYIRLIRLRLSERVPLFMVPTLFIPISHLPLRPTGKLDRLRLRRMIENRTHAELLELTSPEKDTEGQLATKNESLLQAAIAEILGVGEKLVSLSDSFLQLGGDSVAAIKLVGLLRRLQVKITVEHILTSPTLSHLAGTMQEESATGSTSQAPPFSYFQDSEVVSSMREMVMEQCMISGEQVEDIYPTTPLQEGLMTLSSINPGMYESRFVFQLPNNVDVDLLHASWDAVVLANPILRTRLFHIDSGKMFQAVIRERVGWKEFKDLSAFTMRSEHCMEIGLPLIKFALIGRGNSSNPDALYFVLDIHHALYDGWCLLLILNQVEEVYHGGHVKTARFYPFVEHIRRHHSAMSFSFWNSQVFGLSATHFPQNPFAKYKPLAASSTALSFETQLKSNGMYTISTMIRLAWAILLSLYTDSEDVVFGAIVTGRVAPLAGIENIIGPTIAVVPIRVVLRPGMMVKDALEMLQIQSNAMIPFEHTGLKDIARMGSDAAVACNFQNLLVVQPHSDATHFRLFDKPERKLEERNNIATHPLTMICNLHKASFTLEAIFDNKLIVKKQVQSVMQQFGQLLQQLNEDNAQNIRDLISLTKEDMSQLSEWNSNQPERLDVCVQDLIQLQCDAHPTKLAVHGWDGDLTYSDLNRISSLVACQLRKLHVSTDVFVPILFEKSRWTIIAILAVIKSGGAFVLMDTNQPKERHMGLCQNINATVIICSVSNTRKAETLAPNVVVLGNEVSLPALNNIDSTTKIKPQSHNALYMIFTSGSTGKPKGVVIEHRNFATAAKANSEAQCVRSDTRALQLSSYAFDSCMVQILTVLINGGCICVASESECRFDITVAINKYDVNWICITPSVLTILDPDEVPNLRTVLAVGESMAQSQIEMWSKRVNLICGYGPAECSAAATAKLLLRQNQVL